MEDPKPIMREHLILSLSRTCDKNERHLLELKLWWLIGWLNEPVRLPY